MEIQRYQQVSSMWSQQQSLQKPETNLIEGNQEEQETDGISVSISAQGLKVQEMMEEYRQQLEASKDEAEAFKDMALVMEIARRISNGDQVPPQDEKKLMEFSSDLYQMAKAAAIVNANKEHQKYDSLLEDDTNENVEEKARGLEQEASETTDTEATNEVATEENTEVSES